MIYEVIEKGRRVFTDAYTKQKYPADAARVTLRLGGKTATIALENFLQAGYGKGYRRECKGLNFFDAEFDIEVHGGKYNAAAIGFYARDLGFDTRLKESSSDKSINIIELVGNHLPARSFTHGINGLFQWAVVKRRVVDGKSFDTSDDMMSYCRKKIGGNTPSLDINTQTIMNIEKRGRRPFTDAYTKKKYPADAERVTLRLGGKTATIALENFLQAGYGKGYGRECKGSKFFDAEFDVEVHGGEYKASAVGFYARDLGFDTRLKESSSDKSINIIELIGNHLPARSFTHGINGLFQWVVVKRRVVDGKCFDTSDEMMNYCRKKTGGNTSTCDIHTQVRLNTERVLDYLSYKYPNKYINPEAYASEDVFRFSFPEKLLSATGMNLDGWLKSNGFVIGEINEDMRIGDIGKHGFATAEELAEYVFNNYPFAGEHILNDDEEMMLFSRSKEIFGKVSAGKETRISENAVLVLKTIYMLRGFGSSRDNVEDDSMWNYIFRQFGISDETLRRKQYTYFREIIESVMKHYKRYIAPKSTMRYYTTLMLHSMMPEQSIEHFFNILMQFYVENLEYDYVPNDPIYRLLADSLAEKWNSKQFSGDELRLRSDSVASGLKVLFSERREFAAHLSDTLVKKIDACLKGGEIDCSKSRWNFLLNAWLDKRTLDKKAEQKQNIQRHISQRTEINIKQTKGTYTICENDVKIFFPNIRLEKLLDNKPILVVSVNDSEVSREQLGFFGDICTTIRSFNKSLSEIFNSGIKSMNINFKILCGDEELYNSAESLYRKFILFDMKRGVECQLSALDNCRNLGIFAPDSLNIEVNEDKYDACTTCGGSLYDISNDNETYIFIDGERIYASRNQKNSFIFRSSQSRTDGAHAVINGTEYDIYSENPSFTVTIPENENNLHRYRVSHDNDIFALNTLLGSKDNFEIGSIADTMPHAVKIADCTNNKIVFETNYIVIKDFEYVFSEPIYKYPCNSAEVKIKYEDNSFDYNLTVSEQNTVTAPIENGIYVELNVPMVFCTMMGKNVFASAEPIWHKEIPTGAFIDVDCPPQWKCSVHIGKHDISAVSRGKYEAGNFLAGYNTENIKETLELFLVKGEKAFKWKLFDVVFHEFFTGEPLTAKGRDVVWDSEGLFVGGRENNFTIKIFDDGKIIRERTAGTEKECFENLLPDKQGIYEYEIHLPAKSVFAKGTKKIHSGQLVQGDINSFRFNGKAISLKSTTYYDTYKEDMQSMLLETSSYITGLKYLGKSDPYDEGTEYPEYEAELSYFNTQKGQYIKYSFSSNSECERINPVRVRVINNHILEIRNPDGDGLYIDKKHKCILSKRPERVFNYNERSSADPQKNMVFVADSFEYGLI